MLNLLFLFLESLRQEKGLEVSLTYFASAQSEECSINHTREVKNLMRPS